LVATTTTDDDGYYSFTSVAPGNYYIVVEAPDDFGFTAKNVGTDNTIDSDVNSAGQTDVFSLSLGQARTDIDAGLVSLYDASVGDFVWNDANHNGIQDPGEAGLSDISVSLYTSSGSLVGTTTTGSNGYYVFTALDPGSYYLVFTAPTGMVFSPKNQGPDPRKDSDAYANGHTDSFTLAAGQHNPDIDAGLYSSSSAAPGGRGIRFESGRGSGSGAGVGSARPDPGTDFKAFPVGVEGGSGSGSGGGFSPRPANDQAGSLFALAAQLSWSSGLPTNTARAVSVPLPSPVGPSSSSLSSLVFQNRTRGGLGDQWGSGDALAAALINGDVGNPLVGPIRNGLTDLLAEFRPDALTGFLEG
jgi:hypothetical protein